MDIIGIKSNVEFGFADYHVNGNEIVEKLYNLIGLSDKLDDDEINEQACELITELLENKDLLNFVFTLIEDDWEYSETMHGSNPKKHDFVWHYIWESLEEEKRRGPF